MIIAKVNRTRSTTLPARHERSSVLTVESVIRGETLGRLGTREPPRGAVFAVTFTWHAAILPHNQPVRQCITSASVAGSIPPTLP